MTANDNKTRKWSAADAGASLWSPAPTPASATTPPPCLPTAVQHVCAGRPQFEKGNTRLHHGRRPGAHVTLRNSICAAGLGARSRRRVTHGLSAHRRKLINNAGVMWTPCQVKDGFELQFGTEPFGHFALTGLVLDHTLPVPVRGCDRQHTGFTLPSTSTTWERRYNRVAAGRFKLATCVHLRAATPAGREAGKSTIAVAALTLAAPTPS